jgi:predicted lipoprotein with Yx(FWY)xxD motif
VVAPVDHVVVRLRGAEPPQDYLIDGQGHTLYVSRDERGGRVGCTGQCLQVWPRVLVTPAATTAADKPASQTALTRVHTPDGDALAYNGYLLHTYVGDRLPGDASGKGIGGVWSTITAQGVPSA